MKIQSEKELAPYARDWLAERGAEIWEELRHIDVVGKIGSLIISIELKRNLSWKVLDQAYRNLRYSNWSYVLVPEVSLETVTPVVFRHLGIGLLRVRNQRVFVDVGARLNRCIDKSVIKLCTEEAKTTTAGLAGSPNNLGWSQFKQTIAQVTATVKASPGISIKDLIKQVGHAHYSSESCFKHCLVKYIQKGIISNIREEDGKLFPQ